VFIFAGYSFEWRIEYRDKDGTGTPPIPLIPIRLSRSHAVRPLTTFWDYEFYIACASSACGGKSELGLNVAAPECTMVGERIVVCPPQAMRCKQIGVSMAASPQVTSGRASNCCVRLPYPWRESISPLEVGRGCPTYRHRKFSNIVDQ